MRPFHPLSTVDQLANHLRSEIFRGQFTRELPGINQLASRLGCSPRTVTGALQLLLRERVITKQGVGRPFLVTPEKSDSPPGMRVQLLPYDVEDCEQDTISWHFNQIRTHLENAGHVFSFASRSLSQLDMEVKKVARHVKKADADAWIVASGSREILRWFSRQPKPAFALFGLQKDLQIAGVGPDKVSAYREVAHRLIALGHQRIVMLNRPSRRLPSPGFPELAFLEALQQAGIPTGAYNLPNWDESLAGIHRILDELFRLTPPTAMIIDEAKVFIAVQHDLARRGILAPENISLVATDQDPHLDYILPTVAHIRCDTTPWARRICKWADRVAIGKEDRCQTLTRAVFVEGDTIGPPPGAMCAPSRRVMR